MNRKAVIFLADGMADEPLEELGGKTKQEAVDTPAMDSIAARGVNGTFLTLPEGLPTSSDVANMSVLGFYPERNYPGRGPIEAVSQEIPLRDDDVAFRCNLVYASNDGVLRDYSSGHIDNRVSAQQIADLQEKFGNDDVTFHPGVSYRNLLVLHGMIFSDKVNYFMPDSWLDIPLAELRLTRAEDSPEAAYSVEFLNRLCALSAAFLAAHPLNAGKEAPANRIWPWSPGRRPNLQPFSRRYAGRTGAIISAVDVIRGIGKAAGMTVVEVPGATGFIDTNYEGKVAAALKALEDHDFVYIHVEAIDECSHMGDLALKMRAIRDFACRIVAPVLEALRDREVLYAVLPDHPVPLKLRKHTRTPVPVAVCGPGIPADDVGPKRQHQAPQRALGALRADQMKKIYQDDLM